MTRNRAKRETPNKEWTKAIFTVRVSVGTNEEEKRSNCETTESLFRLIRVSTGKSSVLPENRVMRFHPKVPGVNK